MKERKYVKLRVDMYEDTKFKIIDTMEDRDLIHYIWTRLLSLAGKVNLEGNLYMSRNIAYTVKTLSIEFNRNSEKVGLALEVLQKLEMIELSKDGVYKVTNFVKHQNIKVKEKSEIINLEDNADKDKEIKNIINLDNNYMDVECKDTDQNIKDTKVKNKESQSIDIKNTSIKDIKSKDMDVKNVNNKHNSIKTVDNNDLCVKTVDNKKANVINNEEKTKDTSSPSMLISLEKKKNKKVKKARNNKKAINEIALLDEENDETIGLVDGDGTLKNKGDKVVQSFAFS